MRIEFDDGWILRVHDQREFIIGSYRTVWHSISHTHNDYQQDGNTYQHINTMVYSGGSKCGTCGSVPPAALHGYVKLIDWSMKDADA